MTADQIGNRVFKRSFWVAFAFYFIIGFEFFYMVSPFAVYFYSVYRPGLNFINSHPTLAWLSTIFLPHFVSHTKSWLLNSAMILRPRYIVLLSYITMLFFYYNLARFEEKECEKKFGESYLEYMKQTNMFFPIKIKLFSMLRMLPDHGPGRYLGIIGLYAVSCVLGILLANQLRDWSLDQIYAVYTNNAVTISVTTLDKREINHLLHLAMQTPMVKQRLTVNPSENSVKYLNYIVPTDWTASEVPMNPVETATEIHGYPTAKKIEQYKIVFTQSVQRNSADMTGKKILLNTAGRIPLLEVVIDVPLQKVVQIIDPVQGYRLDGIPLPLF